MSSDAKMIIVKKNRYVKGTQAVRSSIFVICRKLKNGALIIKEEDSIIFRSEMLPVHATHARTTSEIIPSHKPSVTETSAGSTSLIGWNDLARFQSIVGHLVS